MPSIKLKSPQRIVEYMGVMVAIPYDHNYVSVSWSEMKSHIGEPELDGAHFTHMDSDDHTSDCLIAYVDMGPNFNWKESVRHVSELNEVSMKDYAAYLVSISDNLSI